MGLVNVQNLAEHGLITDIAPFSVPPNAWTGARNVSFEQGGVTKSGSYVKILNQANDIVNKTHSKLGRIYFTTGTQVFQATKSSNINISRDNSAYTRTDEWFITDLSNVLVFVNKAEVPQMLDVNSDRLHDLTGWGWENGKSNYWRTTKIRAYKNFLLAIGMQEDTAEYTQRIRWSDLALPNAAPSTWDASDTTKSAGFNDLSEARGKLVDGLSMGDYFVLYTTNEVYIMSYTAGNDIFSFRKAFDNVSILAPECATQVNGGHFVVTSSDVIIHNGSSYQSIVTNKIKKELFSNISKGDTQKVKVQAYPAKNEVWVCYQSSPTSRLDRAAIYNLDNATWTYRELPGLTTIDYATFPSEAERIIDDQHMVIDTDHSLINGIGKDFVKGALYSGSGSLEFYTLDTGNSTSNLPSSIIKKNMDFDDWGVPSTQHKFIKAIYPQFTGTGEVMISVGKAETPYEEPNWSPPVSFNIGSDRKADFRVTGRYISVRFESFTNNYWTLLAYGIEGAPRGQK